MAKSEIKWYYFLERPLNIIKISSNLMKTVSRCHHPFPIYKRKCEKFKHQSFFKVSSYHHSFLFFLCFLRFEIDFFPGSNFGCIQLFSCHCDRYTSNKWKWFLYWISDQLPVYANIGICFLHGMVESCRMPHKSIRRRWWWFRSHVDDRPTFTGIYSYDYSFNSLVSSFIFRFVTCW